MYKGELEKQITEVRDNETLIKQSRENIEEEQLLSDKTYSHKAEEIRIFSPSLNDA